MVRLTFFVPGKPPETVEIEEPAELTVGRSDACGFRVESDPMVSRMHAAILVDPPSVRVKDLNSTNGMVINGKPAARSGDGGAMPSVTLRDGDEVTLGRTRIVVHVGSGADAGEAATASSGDQPVSRESARLMFPENGGMASGGRSVGADETVSGMAPVMPAVPGYRLMRLLSPGQAGEIYMAVDNRDGRTVALRIIAPGMVFSRKMLDDFRREAENSARIQHPHIARLLGSGEIGNQGVFLVMEYVKGEALHQYLRRCPDGRIPFAQAYPLMLHLAGALCKIHAAGMVHLDLKPSSIIIQGDDQGGLSAMLTDMGYAHFLDNTGIAPRAAGDVNPARLPYLAPEELTPLGEAKMTADVFSLSAIFYEMLAGRPPYNLYCSTSPSNSVVTAEMTPIDDMVPGLPEPAVVILERGLSPDPDARYGNCCDMLEALENFRG